jgi:hypothetical protein
MKKQLNEIKRMQQLAGILKENFESNFDLDTLSNTLTNLSLEDFIKVIEMAGDYDIWLSGAKQMGTTLDNKTFRAETISTFKEDDFERYNQILIQLGL